MPGCTVTAPLLRWLNYGAFLATRLTRPARASSATKRWEVQDVPRDAFFDLARELGNAIEPGFVPHRLPASSRCLGVFDDDRLVSFAWFSVEPVSVLEVMQVTFAPGDVYMHAAFTLATHRGQGLYPAIMRSAFEHFTFQGHRSLVALVRAENVASLRAQHRTGWETVGRLRYVGKFGRFLVWRDRGCQKHHIQLASAGSMPVWALG